jgi:hypothetical protein
METRDMIWNEFNECKIIKKHSLSIVILLFLGRSFKHDIFWEKLSK